MKRKKFLLICFLAAFAILSAASARNNIFADEINKDLTAQIINKNDVVTYLCLSDIADIFLDSDGLYAADENSVYYKGKGTNNTTKLGVTASKIDKAAGHVLFLNSTGVYLKNVATPLIQGEFSSFAALNDSVYLISKAKDKIVKYDIVTNEETLALTAQKSSNEWALNDISGTIAGICATEKAVFFFSEYRGANTFYLLTEKNKITLNLMNTDDKIWYMAGNKNSDKLAILTSANIYIYSNVSSGKAGSPRVIPFNGGDKLSFDDNNIYVSTLISNIDLIEYSATEAKTSSFIGARSNAEWFYSEPNGISTRNEKIFIADTRNNRVVTLDKNGFGIKNRFGINETLIISPVSAVSTRDNQLIVAHYTNELANVNTGKSIEIKSEKQLVSVIKEMIIDVDDNIYALVEADGENYLISTDPALNGYEILDYDNPSELFLKTSGQACVYSDGKIHFLDGSKSFACEPLKDFYLDYADNVFGINSDNKLVVIKDGDKTVFNISSGASSQLRFDKIAISSTAIDSLTSLNDILLLDSITHSLWKVSGSAAGVVDVSDYYSLDISEITGAKTHKADENLLARAKSNAYLYSRPVESEINCTVIKDQTLFIRLDIKAPENMYFAVVEEVVKADGIIQSGSLKYGYIFRQYVDLGAYTYTPQTNVYGKALTPSVTVYKYPSSYSPTVSTLNSGDIVALMDFALNYLDADNKEWLRISLANDAEGFVRVHLISTSLFSNSAQLKANATVKEDTMSYVYNSTNQTYSPFKSVAKGTRIEVQTPFDRTKTYTKVLFYIDNELVDIDCYILTSNIEYDGVDIIQIVAIAVIVATVVLAVILTVTLSRRNKRKRLEE